MECNWEACTDTAVREGYCALHLLEIYPDAPEAERNQLRLRAEAEIERLRQQLAAANERVQETATAARAATGTDALWQAISDLLAECKRGGVDVPAPLWQLLPAMLPAPRPYRNYGDVLAQCQAERDELRQRAEVAEAALAAANAEADQYEADAVAISLEAGAELDAVPVWAIRAMRQEFWPSYDAYLLEVQDAVDAWLATLPQPEVQP